MVDPPREFPLLRLALGHTPLYECTLAWCASIIAFICIVMVFSYIEDPRGSEQGGGDRKKELKTSASAMLSSHLEKMIPYTVVDGRTGI